MRVDVRVLATSNRDLDREVRQGRFREDLFFRLNILPLEVPPLRGRREDIPSLVCHFLERNRSRQGGSPRELAPEALALLMAYPWPGNVRELENVIERAWVLSDGPQLGPEAFPGIAAAGAGERPLASVAPEGPGKLSGLSMEEVERVMIRDALRRYRGHQKRTAAELGIGVRTLRTKIKKWHLALEERS
jgi:DNA-binding NtrC family response regulator